MRTRKILTNGLALFIALGALLASRASCGATRTDASTAGGPSSVLGTFTLGANQTGRLVVSTPTSDIWDRGRQGQVVLGFDVFRPSTDIDSGHPANGSCLKHHMIERQACQVTLGAGEAASFDVNGDGVSSFQPVVGVAFDGSVRGLMITFEVMESDRVVTAVPLPAVQRLSGNGE